MRREDRQQKQLAYMAVMWNRIEPKDIPPLNEVLGDEIDEVHQEKEQTQEEMIDVLKSFVARSKNNKPISRGRSRG